VVDAPNRAGRSVNSTGFMAGAAVAASMALTVTLAAPLPRAPARREPWAVGAVSSRRRAAAVIVVIAATLGAVYPPVLVLGGAMVVVRRARTHIIEPRRRRRDIDDAFPTALDLLVTALHSGSVPSQAMAEISPYLPLCIGDSFATVTEAVRSGERFGVALRRLDVALGPSALPLTDALITADEYGLPLAPVLDRLASEARSQRRRAADARARELPVRLSIPLVTCTLTSFVLLTVIPLLLGALSSVR
jgi:tight adherence protein C